MGKHTAFDADGLFGYKVDEDLEPDTEEAQRMQLQMALLSNAYSLLGDGDGAEWDVNNEYTRGVFELLAYQLGIDIDHRHLLPLIVRLAHKPTPELIDWVVRMARSIA